MELDSTSPERGLQSSGLCIFTHLLHMLAMTPTPGIINVSRPPTALKVRPERGGAFGMRGDIA